jgi:manganese-dependent ADP-ribose/CDP-alcohol diphosphatase
MDHFKSLITLFIFIFLRLIIYPQTGGTINFNDYVPAGCSNEPVLTIGLIADPQYCDCDPLGSRYYRETMWKLPQAIDTMNKYKVDFVMNLGDMIDRYYESYDSVSKHYEKLDMPYYNLLGNHEFEEVDDELKSTIVSRYGMPGYYYAYSYENWRFLVLDGTELAGYSRYVHPDLAEEGDSVWNSVQGMINGLTWNGGIGKAQQSWLRSEIDDAADSGQNVIMFCHLPVYPDSIDLNLWNKEEIISLLEQYPNIVAYINGHYHQGNYGYKNKIHYYTQAAMLDTPDTNSFGILRIFPRELVIQGFGRVPDRTLPYENFKKKTVQIALSDTVLRYLHHQNDLTGYLSYSSADSNLLANLILDTARYSNMYFRISNDSLLLNTDEDLSLIPDLKINVIAVDCDADTFSQTFDLLFDTTVMKFRYQLSDTVIPVYSDYVILIDSLVEDYSKNGMDIGLSATTAGMVAFNVSDDTLKITPEKKGKSVITLTASDSYTGNDYQQLFGLEVFNPFNHAPYHTDSAVTDYVVQLNDTAIAKLSEIFSDSDGDSLFFDYLLPDSAFLDVLLNKDTLKMIGIRPGEANLKVIADDNYGGTDTLTLDILINSGPARSGEYTTFLYQFTSGCATIYMDSIFTDPNGDAIEYKISPAMDFTHFDDPGQLILCPEYAGYYKIYLTLTDGHGGFYADSLEVRFNAGPEALQQQYQYTYRAAMEQITIVLSNMFTHPDDDTLSFFMYLSDTLSLSYSILGDVLELYPRITDTLDFRIVASDNYGGEDSTMIRLIYKPELNADMANRLINKLKIFPNPSSGIVYIQFELVTDGLFRFCLTDQTGRIFCQSEDLIANQGTNHYEINTKGIKSKGLYFLTLFLDDNYYQTIQVFIDCVVCQ